MADHKFYLDNGIYDFQNGKYRSAIENINKSLELKKDWAIPYFYRAACYQAMEEYDEAMLDYTKAIQVDEKMIDAIDFAIKATDSQDDYSMGMRNGMRYVKSLIDGKEPQYESRRTDKEIKLGIDLGDEVVGDYGAKGVVVGIDTYKGEVWLSLLMRKYKVPQFVEASAYKKTGRHFPQIKEVLEQIKDVVISADKVEREDKK